jgi:hypothetical protein
MKKTNRKLLIPIMTLSMLFIMAMPATSLAAQPTVNLGTTSTFAVLAGSTITNTGTTTINGDVGGDVGLFPGTAFTGQDSASISGIVHIADTVAIKAKADLVTAYDDANGRTPVTRIATELGGTTLTPGVYDSADGTFQITGTLTLDAQGDPDGVFIFKTASTLITASNSNVNLINSARFCRTFWAVGSSATLGTNSNFVGHILAMTSITVNTGASVQGQLLARNGAVTLDNNTITNGICDTTPATGGTGGTANPPAVVVTPPAVVVAPPAVAVTTPAVIIATGAAIVTSPAVTTTVTGGQLPNTSSPLYELLLVGAALILVGSVGWSNRKRVK